MIKKAYKKYKNLSLQVQASIWYAIFNILNKGIALLSTPFFTRLMNASEYGQFAIFQSWYSIFIIFSSMNIFLGSYQRGLIAFKDKKEEFTSSQLGLTTVLTLIVFVVYLIFKEFWLDFSDLSHLLMVFMFIELLAMPAFEFWSVSNRFEYKFKKYAIVTFLSSILSITGGIIAVWLSSNKVEARVISDVLSKLIFALPIFILIFYKGGCFYNRKYWKYALLFNIPLIPHYLANYALAQSDRIMIGKFIGSSEAAFYSVAYTISMMMMLIISAINNSFIPYLYKELDKKNIENIKDITKPIIFLVFILTILTIIFAPEIILIFAGKQYYDAIYVIPPVATSTFFIFIYSLYSNIEYFYEKTAYISLATIISGLLNLFLNYIFIRKYGYYAAGYTTLTCYIFLSLFHYYFYNRILRTNFNAKVDIYESKFILIMSLLLIVIMLIMTITYKSTILRYSILLLMLLVIIKKREFILKSLQILRRTNKVESN